MLWHDRSEWVVVDGQHEPLVSEELFALANERAKPKKRDRSGVDMSGFKREVLFVCGYCGRSMVKKNHKYCCRYRTCGTDTECRRAVEDMEKLDAAINAWRDRNRRRQKEISFEYLTEEKFYPLSTSDEFLKSPYEQYPVTICGQTIILTNGELAAALLSLPEKKREIIYLYFFGNYTQQEIADLYGQCKSTAWHYIHSALQMLQEEMEGFSHGEY